MALIPFQDMWSDEPIDESIDLVDEISPLSPPPSKRVKWDSTGEYSARSAHLLTHVKRLEQHRVIVCSWLEEIPAHKNTDILRQDVEELVNAMTGQVSKLSETTCMTETEAHGLVEKLVKRKAALHVFMAPYLGPWDVDAAVEATSDGDGDHDADADDDAAYADDEAVD